MPPGAENTRYPPGRLGEPTDLPILTPDIARMHVETVRVGLHWVADNLTAGAALSFRPHSALPRHRQVAAVLAAPDGITITDGATRPIP